MADLVINRDRLLERHRLMASFGDTGNGGVIRPALSDEETAARSAILDLARERGFICSVDPIGNLFIRRNGEQGNQAPLRIGSHLDSQIPGGNFDGVYGVIAAFEVLETLEDRAISTSVPVEVVIWNNEEGARFSPTTMGSGVHAGALPLDQALAARDTNGKRVDEELARSLEKLGQLFRIGLGTESSGYIEAHIEQGPVLEASNTPIGVVTGIQGIIQLQVTVSGEEAHAGTTPRSRRRDALFTALDLIADLRALTTDPDDEVRFTVGRLSVLPGAPNTVPSNVVFTIDLRHPSEKILETIHAQIIEVAATFRTSCHIDAVTTLASPPVCFDADIRSLIETSATSLHLKSAAIASGATHDAKFMGPLCPTGMIFIPCRDGISHNEKEWAEFEHMVAGADVLLRAVSKWASPDIAN
ncbi:M20 family metallo-hydrolase [Aminobacter ciceronei]|uniref:N-carbamoyl-L-amino-acid hydrolase n=1 Tax=Aminobacter ciceronei TaxID=150723 RepID=A0ABR6CI58_9HYPH|nr:M20 family metallo-hydrolase [Aminobacter ciceronei]MBA8910542.1 N-carbamoyl-L-amino-acid hydrolase [Aminobacter ciceronei]MBA9024313.1 N-carbamoyl-L-amino-acid hydrolase [Aminobacter ciceronei]